MLQQIKTVGAQQTIERHYWLNVQHNNPELLK